MSGLGDLLKGQGGLGSVLGGLMGGGGGGTAAALIPVLAGVLGGGGLNKILSGLQGGGLKQQADSWVGKGDNEPVTGPELHQALGEDQIAEIAAKLGVSNEEAANSLAEVLPEVVNHVTPDGTVPPTHEVDGALGALGKLLGH